MRIGMTCMQCIQSKVNNFDIIDMEVRDDGTYAYTCNQDHTNTVILQNNKFEVLFEMGALALLDGYSREAVTSFATALERFYEFCINVILAHQGIQKEMYLSTWKHLGKQSERQLGAFYVVYLSEFKQVPDVFAQKAVELRNDVTHKGLIPSRKQAEWYGEKVYNYILKVSRELRKQCQSSLFVPHSWNHNFNLGIQVLSMRTIIDFALADELFGVNDFSQAMNELKNRLRMPFGIKK